MIDNDSFKILKYGRLCLEKEQPSKESLQDIYDDKNAILITDARTYCSHNKVDMSPPTILNGEAWIDLRKHPKSIAKHRRSSARGNRGKKTQTPRQKRSRKTKMIVAENKEITKHWFGRKIA